MASVQIPLQWAPNSLYQPILPNWQVSLFSVDLGDSSNAQVERAAIKRVGSYGKQLGHLAEALEVVIERLKLLDDRTLPREQRDALKVFLGDVAATRKLKQSPALTA